MSRRPNAFFVWEKRRSILGLLRDVRLHGDGLPAVACDLGDHAVRALLAGGIVDGDRCALRRQMLGDGGADALGGAGHDRHLARELAHVLAPFWLLEVWEPWCASSFSCSC